MPDHMTPEQRSRAMSSVKLKNGPLEQAVCTGLRRRGLRFKKHVKRLPGTPDVAFMPQKVAVFVDGDFWHGYRLPEWEHKLKPFWLDKIRANRNRDSRNFRKLRYRGWKVIRVWQHQIEHDLDACIQRIWDALHP